MQNPEYSFEDIVGGEELKSLQNHEAALDGGFSGPYATEIAEWKSEGLGRLIRIPYAHDPNRSYAGLYALPNTIIFNGRIASALVLVPRKDGVDACVVDQLRDQTVLGGNVPSYDSATRFNECLAPRNEHFIHTDWNPDPSKPLFTSFIESAKDKFSALVVQSVIPENKLRPMIQRSLRFSAQFRK